MTSPGPILSGEYLWPERINRPAMFSAFSSSSQTGVTTEVASLTVPSVVFEAGWAYEAQIRGAVYGTAGAQALFRLRKTTAAGTDWGEFGRVRCEGTSAGQSAMANGSIVLLRSALTDLTATVVLTITPTAAATVNIFASAISPRYIVIRPCGYASEYAGTGVEVT